MIFDHFQKIIKYTSDRKFQKKYGRLVSVYQDKNGSFKNVIKDTISQFNRNEMLGKF